MLLMQDMMEQISVMLSAESAVGKYPIESISIMDKIIQRALKMIKIILILDQLQFRIFQKK